jgi:hypothetical protein
MRSRLLISVFAFALTGVIASCNDVTSVSENFEEDATWVANLNAANEVQTPAVNSPATGRAWFVDRGDAVDFFLEYDGLVANATGAHIHRGLAGTNGQIMVTLSFVGRQSGFAMGTIDMTRTDVSEETAIVVSPDDLRNLMNGGGVYANVHSTTYPNGEIRGQVNQR